MDGLVTYRNIRLKYKTVTVWASPYGVYCYPYCNISFNSIIKHSKFCIYGEIEKMEGWSITFKKNKKNKILVNKANRIYFIRDEDIEIIS